MKFIMFLALLGMAVLSLAGTSLNETEALRAALTSTSPDHLAIATHLVRKDGGFDFIGSEENDTTTTSASSSITSYTMAMSTITAVHKNITTAFWTLWESGWASAMVISTQSAADATSIFTTSTFNDTISTTTPVSYARVPTLSRTNGKQVIFTVTTILEGTFDVLISGLGGMHWATTSSAVNTQTDWPWPPTKSMTVPVSVVTSTTWTTTTVMPTTASAWRVRQCLDNC